MTQTKVESHCTWTYWAIGGGVFWDTGWWEVSITLGPLLVRVIGWSTESERPPKRRVSEDQPVTI